MRTPGAPQLKHVLLIPDPAKETIFGVVGRMETLIGLFETDERYHALLPFLQTYYYVTKASAEVYVQEKHFFINLRDYELLDVYFATLYFTPLYRYLIAGVHEPPWKTYFSYCEEKQGLVFLRMLLGINAHINGDLYRALVDLDYRHERDFFHVNDILMSVIPDVTKYLVFKEHDVLSMGGLVMKHFFLTEFHRVIEKWRSEAWVRAKYLRRGKRRDVSFILKETEQTGRSLIVDFENRAAIPFLLDTLSTETGRVRPD